MKIFSTLLLGVLMLGSSFLQAQDYRLDLASGHLGSYENLSDYVANPLPKAEELFSGRYYRLVQFYSIPSQRQKVEMEAEGVRFLDFVPNFAFLVSIPENINPLKFQGYGIRSIHTLKAEHKIKTNLQERPLPSWTILAPGKVDIELVPFRDISMAAAEAALQNFPLEILPQNNVGALTVRLSPDDLPALAALPLVCYLEPIAPPAKAENYTGRTLHRSNVIASDDPMGRHYNGEGVLVAMGDDGIIGPHIDYQGRIDLSRVSQDNGDHGDHVAGTIMGAGNLDPKHKGMAYGADLNVYQVWDAVNDGANANQQDGVMLTSTSYSNGCNAGYTSFARTVDQMTRQNPTLLHVFSAGNAGTDNCNYGAGSGWGNVTGGVKIGKNVIAVANLNHQSVLNSSSSRGPAHDGRIKPEISAKGVSVISTLDGNNYGSKTGTSMSCPGVSGTLAQLIQAYRDLNSGQDPQSGLMKATLLNSADDIGNPGPDFKHGFGRMNSLRAVQVLEEQHYFSGNISQGSFDTISLNVPAGMSQVKVMLYWHDYEAAVLANTALVNNLDLVVNDGSNTWLPWVLDHSPNVGSLNSNATRGIDNLNNMEQVTIDLPTGGNYEILVSGTGVPFGPQEYFLVYEFLDSSIAVTHPHGGESFVPGELEKIRWDAQGDYGAWTVEYTTNGGATWLLETSGLSGDRRYYNWNIPSGLQTADLKFRLTRGTEQGESNNFASVIRVPNNLEVTSSCPSTCVLSWDSMSTATSYQVFQLGSKYMDSIGVTNNASFAVSNVAANDPDVWFAVRAHGPNGEVGRRTIAINKQTGVFNCSNPDDARLAAITRPGTGVFPTCSGNLVQQAVTVLVENMSPNSYSGFSLTYQYDNGSPVTENFPGSLAAYDTVSYTFSTLLNMSNPGNHSLKAWVTHAADPYAANDSSTVPMEIVTGTLATLPYTENFDSWNNCNTSSNCENSTCGLGAGWIQATNNYSDAIDWRTDNNGTPSSGTGPGSDHTTGTSSGNYLYLEASSCFEREGHLMSPCFDLAGMTQPLFSFWFHKLGDDQGPLHIDLLVDGQWVKDIVSPKISNWYNIWWKEEIDLTAYVGKVVVVRFRGITGEDYQSDVALDDIGLLDGTTNSVDPALSSGLQVYPNPSTGLVNYAMKDLSAEQVVVRVFDVRGKELWKEAAGVVNGDLLGKVDLGSFGAGMYFLQIQVGDKVIGRRLMVD